ncbi:ABC transporter substrate-binding protein [Microbacterium sp. NPDC058345]|uniref:ABC transporter substrate-binding protein n=1 Tax=Microbacterium sp. NPDC058345 TaxID=3346455 RepID=UPI00365FCC7B
MSFLPPPSRGRGFALAGRAVLVAFAMALFGLSGCAAAPSGATADGSIRSAQSGGRVIDHELGETEVPETPVRVVALEFSFVQALDSLDVVPVGIADDDDPARIAQLLGKEIDYASVGTRLEPNLELVSSLRPDLIIADVTRHAAIYDQLRQIAPTIVLNSWEGSYADIKASVVTIADALGDQAAGEQAVAEHEARMAEYAARIPADEDRRFLLAVATPDAMSLHTSSAFTGSVFEALGVTAAMESDQPVESGVGIERLIDVDPDVLFVAVDAPGTVLEQWSKSSVWASMSAARDDAVYEVNRNQYARFRGLQTAELIAEDIVENIAGDH